MAINLKFLVTFGLLTLIATKFLGIPGLLLGISFAVVVTWLANKLGLGMGIIPKLPFPGRIADVIGMASLIVLAVNLGWIAAIQGMLSQPAAFVSPIVPATITSSAAALDCKSGVNPDLLGKAATVTLDAYDMEANSPYSNSVDVTGYLFKNGIYLATVSDTTSGTVTNLQVGDQLTFYGNGSTFYTDTKAFCVDGERPTVEISAHRITGETNLEVTGYDSTASTTLTGGTSNLNDYNVTLGSGSEETFYLKLKQNTANRAYNFCGWNVARFFNISRVDAVDDDLNGAYAAQPTVTWTENINVQMASSSENTINKDYTPWKRGSVLLSEWDTIKTQFVVEASSTNDPVARFNTTSFNGFAVVAYDCQGERGSDGKVSVDFYQHDTGEANVGLAETLNSPIGRQSGVLVGAV